MNYEAGEGVEGKFDSFGGLWFQAKVEDVFVLVHITESGFKLWTRLNSEVPLVFVYWLR